MSAPRLASLQALRGAAAACVVIAHIGAIETATGDAILGARTLFGLAGVDVFFVISGFVMVWTSWTAPAGTTSAARFLRARARRIYPLWWLAAAAAALAYAILSGSPTDPDAHIPHNLSATVGHLLASFALWPQADLPVLSVGWTLVHEVWFYLVFAGLLLAPERTRIWLLAAWAGLVLLFGATIGEPATPAPDLAALARHPLTLEFLAGATIALAVRSGFTRAGGWALAAGLAGLLFAVLGLGIDAAERFPEGWTRVAALGAPAALIVYGAVALEARGGWRPPALMIALGDQSYALYLSHVFVVWGLTRLVWAPVAQTSAWDNLVALPTIFAAALAVGWAAHRWIERPLLRALRPSRPPTP